MLAWIRIPNVIKSGHNKSSRITQDNNNNNKNNNDELAAEQQENVAAL